MRVKFYLYSSNGPNLISMAHKTDRVSVSWPVFNSKFGQPNKTDSSNIHLGVITGKCPAASVCNLGKSVKQDLAVSSKEKTNKEGH